MTITETVSVAPLAHSPRSGKERGDWLPVLLLLPSLALIGGIIVYPLLTGMSYSVHSGNLIRPGPFVGLDNYRTLASMQEFYHALSFSLLFAVVNVICGYCLGLGIALLMNADIPGRAFFRVVFLLPWIIPSIVSVLCWRWLLADQNAPVNQLIGFLGAQPIYFLADDFWAQVTVFMIKIWRSFPFMMVSILAALQGIDRSLYEAAAVDGASRWKMFTHITLPQIRNISFVLCILMTIWTINDFETPWLITQGGPANATENLILLAHRLTFGRNQIGLGSAVSFITFLILTALALLMQRQQRDTQ
jgi:ABC-type sugar transport system permease subunit